MVCWLDYYFTVIASSIQTVIQALHLMHFWSLILATLFNIWMASIGQVLIQAPHPIQASLFITIFILNTPYSGFGKPMLSETSFIAFSARSANSGKGMSSSIDHMASLSAPAAKRVSFIRFVMDLTLTLWTFLSG